MINSLRRLLSHPLLIQSEFENFEPEIIQETRQAYEDFQKQHGPFLSCQLEDEIGELNPPGRSEYGFLVDLEKYFRALDSRKAERNKTTDWIHLPGPIMPSVKTMAIKFFVMKWLTEEPDCKIIIFTQIQDMLVVSNRSTNLLLTNICQDLSLIHI